MPQASAAPAQTKMASRRLEPEEIKLFITRGEQLMATGDIVAARTVFQRAAESDEAMAALALGAAYDPNVLARLGVVGISADLEKARAWYQKAESLGSPDARRRLGLLDR
jgi:TPR repeat protein